MCMTLKRRLVILMSEEDAEILERMALSKGMGTTTLARSFILEGMTRYGEELRAAGKRGKR